MSVRSARQVIFDWVVLSAPRTKLIPAVFQLMLLAAEASQQFGLVLIPPAPAKTRRSGTRGKLARALDARRKQHIKLWCFCETARIQLRKQSEGCLRSHKAKSNFCPEGQPA